MIEVEGVRRTFRPMSGWLRMMTRGATSTTIVALDDVHLAVDEGRVAGLVGPNGAGKSTLIRILAGLLDPDEGRVRVAGHDPQIEPMAARRALGLVLADDRSLYWRLTGRENLEFHGALYGLAPAAATARADELLELVRLDGTKRVFGYSTGMRARLGIARALVHDPRVLVLDEPTRSLDPVAAREVCDLLRSLAASGRTILISSHHLEELERMADDVAVLLTGRIEYVGPMGGLGTGGRSAANRLIELLEADLGGAAPMIRVMKAVLRRDWAIERTYHLHMILLFTETLGLAFGLYYVSKVVQVPPELAAHGITYFDFALVGVAVNSFAALGLQSFSSGLVREQSTGTVELLFAVPVPLGHLMLGMFLFPFILAAGEVAALLGFGVGVVGSGLSWSGLVLSIPVLLLTTASFAAIGVASAGLLMIAKRGDPLSGPFFQVSLLLSGALYPVEVLPAWLRAISYCIPATWGVKAVRGLLLGGESWSDVAPEVAVLCAFLVVLIPLSLVAFRSCLRVARREGLLGAY